MAEIKFTPMQKKVIESRNKNMIVSAAAGSGKTTVMIERIKDLMLKDHVDISNFLIVTFTKASSEDMREKLVNKLSNEEPSPFLLDQIDKISTADVSNLHSFCAKLLKTYFYEAGIDPTFVVIAEEEAKILQQKALNRLLDELVNDKKAYNLLDALQQNRKDENIRQTILKLYDFFNVLLDKDEWFDRCIKNLYNENINKNQAAIIINNYVGSRVDKILKEIHDRIEEYNNLHLTEFVEYLGNIESEFLKIRSSNGFAKNAERIYEIKPFGVPPKVDGAFEEVYHQLDEYRKTLKKEVENFQNNFVSNNVEQLLKELKTAKELAIELYEITNRYGEIYSSIKKEKGGLDFNDLEHYTLKILQNPEILDTLKNKYKYIFVDEYQDINSVQEQIISLISGKTNRFMVGDIKQSIYRFRLCDPDIFLDKYNKYSTATDSEKIDLADNFRSNKHILEFVNDIFCGRMTKDFGGVDYKETSQFIAGSSVVDDCPVTVYYIDAENLKKTKHEVDLPLVYSVKNHQQIEESDALVCQAEVEYIVKEIKNLVANTQICDAKTNQYRHIRFKDIAILVPTREEFVPELVKSLENNNIPFNTDIKENVLNNTYIKSLHNYIKLIYNSNQDIQLFTCLYSPIFNFSLNELAEIRENAKNCSYFYQSIKLCIENDDISANLKQKLQYFMQKLNEYKRKSKYKTLKQLVNEIVEDFDIYNFMLTEVDSASQIDLLNKYVANLPEENIFEYFSDDSNVDLFAEKTNDANAVQILTIHKSKGLEFPITFVANVGRQFNMQNFRATTIISKDYGIGIDFYDTVERYKNNTIAKEAVKLTEIKKSVEEQQRLLYVALTRAINKLYVVGTFEKSKIKKQFPERKNRFSDWIDPLVYKFLCGEEVQNVKIEVLDAEDLLVLHENVSNSQVILNKQTNEYSQFLQEAINFEYPNKKYTAIPQKTSVTEIASGYHESEEVYKQYNNITKASTSSAEKGNAYHKLMQYVDFDANSPEKLKENIQKLIQSGKIAEEELKLIKIENIIKLLNNQEFISIVNSGTVLREQEFFMNMGTRENVQIVQGVIDLAIILDDGIIVLDYKTGNFVSKENLEKYSKQIELYSLAAKKIYQKKTIKKAIIAVEQGEIYYL